MIPKKCFASRGPTPKLDGRDFWERIGLNSETKIATIAQGQSRETNHHHSSYRSAKAAKAQISHIMRKFSFRYQSSESTYRLGLQSILRTEIGTNHIGLVPIKGPPQSAYGCPAVCMSACSVLEAIQRCWLGDSSRVCESTPDKFSLSMRLYSYWPEQGRKIKKEGSCE